MQQHTQVQTSSQHENLSYDTAFVQLYQSYYTKVFAFVYSRVGNVELSKDLVAEIFERAYVKGHDLREPSAYGTWVFMIARNHVAGHYRRQKREMNGLDRVKDSLWLTEGPPDPESRALRSEQIQHLMRHFRTLPRRDQELLSLKFDAELTYAEIARIMGMSDVNVRVSIFRALRRLRDRLQKDREEADARR
ncbi:MAG: RNA polymerase sigma factor [Chloroflexi bacterium]|nr:RNA polymerase sigma factor [Chloroflexota bacterium]